MFIGGDYEGHSSHIGRKCVFKRMSQLIGEVRERKCFSCRNVVEDESHVL